METEKIENILVTGAAGFIGFHLSQKLLNNGNNHPVDLMKYIETLEECPGKKAQKNFLPMQKGDVPATCADVDDLRVVKITWSVPNYQVPRKKP